MIKKLLTALFSLTIVLSASGCSRYIRRAVSIPNSSGQETVAIDVAVDSSGVKHIVRKVCYTDTPADCMIVYTKAISGDAFDVYTWTLPSGYTGMENPVIEVTDNGVAAIAWETYRTTGGTKATLYVLSTSLATVSEINPFYYAWGVMLVSKGNTIYSVQNVDWDGSYLHPLYPDFWWIFLWLGQRT